MKDHGPVAHLRRTSDKTASLVLVHHHPGRLRLRSDAFRVGPRHPRANDAFERVCHALVKRMGVRDVVRNETSGSVLVLYEPGVVDPNVLIDIVSETAGLGPPLLADERDQRPRHPADAAIDLVRHLDAKTRELTDGRADLRTLVPLAMTGMAALSFIAKKDRMPHWANLAFWAYSIFQNTYAVEIATPRPERQRSS